MAFCLPQGVDAYQAAAAYEEWNSSTLVNIGAFVMMLAPLLVSGFCGVFVHDSLPASVPAALLRMAGVVLILVVVFRGGSWAIVRTLSTGESSDILPGIAMIAFFALCISLAAPLSSVVTRRRIAH